MSHLRAARCVEGTVALSAAGYAARAWRSWYRKAMRSRIEPLRLFAQKLRPYLSGILVHCRWPLGTNLVEGINNKIKVIKRMACGYRDDAHFFLKIRAAFPGVGRSTKKRARTYLSSPLVVISIHGVGLVTRINLAWV
jgi:transposase